MKSAILLVLSSIVSIAQADVKSVIDHLKYNVVSAECFVDGSMTETAQENEQCEFDFERVQFTRNGNEIQYEKVSPRGGSDFYFLSTQRRGGKQSILAVDEEMKYIDFTDSREIWADTEFVIERITLSVNFYQVSATEAVLVESYYRTTSEGTFGSAKYVVKLQR